MKKKVLRVLSIKLILPIKMYYIPDFENVWSREQKVMTKKEFFGA